MSAAATRVFWTGVGKAKRSSGRYPIMEYSVNYFRYEYLRRAREGIQEAELLRAISQGTKCNQILSERSTRQICKFLKPMVEPVDSVGELIGRQELITGDAITPV